MPVPISKSILALSAGVAMACAPSQGETPSRALTTQTRLTDWPGAEGSARVSPDGRRVAFQATVDGQTDIYIKDLETGRSHRVTDTPSNDRRPAWSPDGTRIAFHSDRPEGLGFWIVNADGSDPRLVYAENDAQLRGPDWSPDGTRLAFSRLVPDGEGNVSWGRSTVMTVRVDGSHVRELTTTGDEWWPRWDADSEWLYYYTGAIDDVEAVHGETGQVRSISRKRYVGWMPVPSPDRRSIVFTSHRGWWSLWIAPLDGSMPPIRLTTGGRDGFASFTPDGRAIVFDSDRARVRAVRLELATGATVTLAEDARDPHELPGGPIALLVDRDSLWDVAVLDEDGGRPVTVTTPHQHIVEARFSPDGRRIAVVSTGVIDGAYDVSILGADGTPTGVSTTRGDVESPVWCGNTSLVIASRAGDPHRWRQVWHLDPGDGSTRELTKSEVSKRPTDCSPDGSRITYRLIAGSTGIGVAERRGDAYVTTERAGGQHGTWSPDGRRFAFVDRRDGMTDIFVHGADGVETRATHDAAVESLPNWSRDGRSLLYSVSEPNRDIWMVEIPSLPWRGGG